MIDKRARTLRIVGVHPPHHGLRVASAARSNARGAAALSDLVERERALAGAGVGYAQGQLPQILRRLTPARRLNT